MNELIITAACAFIAYVAGFTFGHRGRQPEVNELRAQKAAMGAELVRAVNLLREYQGHCVQLAQHINPAVADRIAKHFAAGWVKAGLKVIAGRKS